MVKKRKSKANKIARMNEEERARYIQHRIEFELETKRRKQQLIATFTKNKLKREESFSKLNIAKINEKWRYVLRQIKCKELHENVKYLQATFDRAITIKDSTISCLHNELNIANADHRKLQETHTALIDTIIEKYKQNLIELHNTYKTSDIKFNNIIELTSLKTDMEQNYKEISNNLTRKAKDFNKTQTMRKTQYAINTFSILHLEEGIASDLVHQSFLNIEYLWEQLCKTINEYQKIIENRKKQYEYLKEQDIINQMSTLQYLKIHAQSQNIIESLKVNTQMLLEKKKEKIIKLNIKDKYLREKLKNIKYGFSITETVVFSQLKKLSVTSNNVIKHLQQIERKGSVILETITICAALEPLLFKLKKYFIQDTIYTEIADTNVPESCAKVNNLWKCYNYIKVNNIVLKNESNKLCIENKKLQHKLQSYLTTNSGILALHPIASSPV
ncbi:dynein regulatory complex subunit 2 [Xylocopa sonorina]|uniref:dynein regulatory complex subunit 2 n=1 Tax=Xylocopa sonorina TaxID=1818115 RepID=UPI00403AE70C